MISLSKLSLAETIAWRGAGDIVTTNDGLLNVKTVFVEFGSEFTEIGLLVVAFLWDCDYYLL